MRTSVAPLPASPFRTPSNSPEFTPFASFHGRGSDYLSPCTASFLRLWKNKSREHHPAMKLLRTITSNAVETEFAMALWAASRRRETRVHCSKWSGGRGLRGVLDARRWDQKMLFSYADVLERRSTSTSAIERHASSTLRELRRSIEIARCDRADTCLAISNRGTSGVLRILIPKPSDMGTSRAFARRRVAGLSPTLHDRRGMQKA